MNIQGIGEKYNILEAFVSDIREPDVICITEHFVTEEFCQDISIDGWHTAATYGRKNTIHGGVAVLSKDQNFTVLENINSLSIEIHCEVAAVYLDKWDINVITIYRSSSNGDFNCFLERIDLILSNFDLSKKLILCGDFNVHFNNVFDRSAGALCDLLATYGFQQRIHEPTRNQNTVDNIFLNFDPLNEKTSICKCAFSDHHGQLVSMDIPGKNVLKSSRKVRPLTKRGFNVFHSILNNLKWDFIKDSNIKVNDVFNTFHQNFVDSYRISFPEREIRDGECSVRTHWYTEKLRNMKNDLDLVCELYDIFRTDNLKLMKSSLKLKYKLEINNAKVRSNDQTIANATNKVGSMWNLINSKRKRSNNNKTTDISANEFGEFFASIPHDTVRSIQSHDIDSDSLFLKKLPDNLEFSFREISFNEVRDVVMSLNNSKSRDYYDLSVVLLKKNINSIIHPLTLLINRCIKEGVFPDCLKISKTIPLFKKGDVNDPSNFRPISLVPIFSKVFEKIISNQIINFFNVNNLFARCQFGFRKNKSTSDAITEFINHTLTCFEEGLSSLSLFLDLTKAFDCVSHTALLKKLGRYGFDGGSGSLLRSFLSNRIQAVFVADGWSDNKEIKIGVPQGSILGPLLFLIFINDFPDYLSRCLTILFADDSTLSVACDDLERADELFASTQSDAFKWFSGGGLCMNSNKTEKVIFSLKDVESSSVKFLGIYLDTRLTWSVHVDQLSKKLSKNIFVLRNLRSQVSTNVLKTAYYALCESHLKYGLLAWGSSAECGRIFRLQRRAIRIVDGIKYRDCCKDSFKKLNILTLPSLFIFECLIYVHRNLKDFKLNGDVHNHNTRRKNDIHITCVRLGKSQNGPNILSCRYYNFLPLHFRDFNLNKFKSVVRGFLFQIPIYNNEEFFNINFNV